MNGYRTLNASTPITLALCVLLAACAADDAAPIVDNEDGCEGIPLAKVLPDADPITSKRLVWRRCMPAQVSACYSTDENCSRGLDRCEITVHDAAYGVSPNPGDGGSVNPHDHAQSMILSMSKVNVDMLKGTRDGFLEFPEMLAQIGGPPHLPVVDTLATGDTYVIPVPSARQNPRRGELRSVIADRYALIIECGEPLRDNAHAQRVYGPFLDALNLAELP